MRNLLLYCSKIGVTPFYSRNKGWWTNWVSSIMSLGGNIVNNKQSIFEEYHPLKALTVMAVPAVMSQLITLIYNIADTWFIGMTNDPGMVAACSLVLPIYMMVIVISNLFGAGGGSLISRLLGEKNETEAKKVFAVSFYMAVGVSVIFSGLTMAFCDPLLRLLGASSVTLGYGKQYLLYAVGIGGTFNVMSMVLSNLIRSCGYSREAGIGMSLGGVINIFLDPIFMFKVFPEGQQVAGAAFATMLSNIIAFGYFVVVCFRIRKKTVISVNLKEGLPRRKSVASIFGVGVPAAVAVLLFDVSSMVANKLMANHGDTALAAYGIVTKVERLPLNIGIGICLGMIPLVAYNYSAGNFKRMKSFFNWSRVLGLGIAVICVFLYFVGSREIMRFFIGDSETITLGTAFLKARCFATPFMFLCFNMVHYFNALGKGQVSFGLAFIRQLVFNIPIMLFLNRQFGAFGLVWTQLIADMFTVIVSYIAYGIFRPKPKQNLTMEG